MGTISPPPSKRRKLSGSTSDLPPILSVFSHNVNGIAPYLQRSIKAFFHPTDGSPVTEDRPRASLRDFLRRHHYPCMLLLQEIKVNPEDRATIRALERAVGSESGEASGPEYVVHTCLPTDQHNARGFGRKVYGVACIIRKDWYDEYVETVRPVSWDVEGRFLVTETKPVGPNALAIINIYGVNGTEAPYKNGNGAIIGTRHTRKLHTHRLLSAECRALEARGFGVILAGDMNVARSSLDGFPRLRTSPDQHCINRADFEEKFFASPKPSKENGPTAGRPSEPSAQETGGLGMVDTFRHLFPGKNGYTYYPRGKTFGESCDRVDMIIVSKSLAEYVADAGMMETPAERGTSDHVPLYAVFDFTKTADQKEP